MREILDTDGTHQWKVIQNVITPAAEEIGKQVVKSLMTKKINEYIKDEDLKIFTNNKKK